jgi:hypothetical protein
MDRNNYHLNDINRYIKSEKNQSLGPDNKKIIKILNKV